MWLVSNFVESITAFGDGFNLKGFAVALVPAPGFGRFDVTSGNNFFVAIAVKFLLGFCKNSIQFIRWLGRHSWSLL